MPTTDPDDDTAPDTWTCPDCGHQNWDFLLECPKCREPKP